MTSNTIGHPRDRLIVALDLPTVDEARGLVRTLGDEVGFYKIGLELILSANAKDNALALVGELASAKKKVFFDAKLLDIGNTVERAVANVAKLGATFLTIHGHDRKTLAAAMAGKGESDLKLLAVTVLTSLNAEDLRDQRIEPELARQPADLVRHRAKMAADSGFDGVISSGQEAASIRSAVDRGFLIVTPGIRLPGGDAGDQQRITTPEDALSSGADHLVVGRPINQARDPKAAAADFVSRIAAATESGTG